MSSSVLGPGLRGRAVECQALDQLLTSVRAGRSRVLVVRGEAGVGRTALLDHLVRQASGCRVTRTAGVESERELAFAGLHLLCAPLLAGLDRLPGPQRTALGTAFGLRAGGAPDRFLIGLATLTLLADAAAERPLVCVVDDVQWLDPASTQVLAFVARRLGPEPVGLVLAEREPGDDLAGLAELPVTGLGDEDARAVLTSVVPGPLDAEVRDRLVAEARGNPLALLDVSRGLPPAEVAVGFGLPGSTPRAGRVERGFLRRLAPLPADVRRLLLTAAVEPVGDVTVLWRAVERLGLAAGVVAAAEASGLVEIGTRVLFRHPLARSAACRAASAQDLLEAHRALADVTDPRRDPDRRAWHRAQGAVGPDETVAGELVRSVGRARSRGGMAAAAAFLQRATELTPDPARRAPRALAAAESRQQAGAPESALDLLALAEAGPLDELGAARAELLRARTTSAVGRGPDAARLLLRAARRLQPLDAALARDAWLDAFSAALCAGDLARGGGVAEVAAAVLAADPGASAGRVPQAGDLLLDGLAVLTTRGRAAGVPMLRRALSGLRAATDADDECLRWLWLACRVARDLGDDRSWAELSDRQVRIARRAGALALLPRALAERFDATLLAGEVGTATALLAEADAVLAATGGVDRPQGALLLAAWRGRETEALALADADRRDAERCGEGLRLTAGEWTGAVLLNGLGRYAEALAAAQRAAGHPHALGLSTWIALELVEAAVRSGQAARAAAPLVRLTEIARTSGTDCALAIEARSRALLADGPSAEALYREAIDRFSRTRLRPASARAHLLFGEWLRRERRRTEARDQLRTAHGMCTDLGMAAFAERARRELLATGATARRRSVDAREELTAQEVQIARLAGQRHTNPEIGAELFLSPRTVEWHLRKVFTKLGVSSRRELQLALPEC